MDSRLIPMAILVLACGQTVFSQCSSSITNTDCWTSKMCMDEPVNCDPSQSDSCLFTSLKASMESTSAKALTIELSRNSSGYIALGLASSASEAASDVFVCGVNNGKVFLQTASFVDGSANLTATTSNSTGSISTSICDSKIECTFTAHNVSNTNLYITIFEGNGNETDLGSAKAVVSSRIILPLTLPSNVPSTTTTRPLVFCHLTGDSVRNNPLAQVMYLLLALSLFS